MTDYYQPQPDGQLRTPEGEPIYLGPYTSQQAPFIECSHCGQPITVGQTLVLIQPVLLGVTQSGKLVFVPKVDFADQAFVHEDCATEFSHDHITKDTCGENVETTCQYCDARLNGDDD